MGHVLTWDLMDMLQRSTEQVQLAIQPEYAILSDKAADSSLSSASTAKKRRRDEPVAEEDGTLLLSRSAFAPACRYCDKKKLEDPNYQVGGFSAFHVLMSVLVLMVNGASFCKLDRLARSCEEDVSMKAIPSMEPDGQLTPISLSFTSIWYFRTCSAHVCTSSEIYKRHRCPPGFSTPIGMYKAYKNHKKHRTAHVERSLNDDGSMAPIFGAIPDLHGGFVMPSLAPEFGTGMESAILIGESMLPSGSLMAATAAAAAVAAEGAAAIPPMGESPMMNGPTGVQSQNSAFFPSIKVSLANPSFEAQLLSPLDQETLKSAAATDLNATEPYGQRNVSDTVRIALPTRELEQSGKGSGKGGRKGRKSGMPTPPLAIAESDHVDQLEEQQQEDGDDEKGSKSKGKTNKTALAPKVGGKAVAKGGNRRPRSKASR
ncbi:hypothetical protein HDU97_007080 [Phlyctochytrium planicorne]|nr:hypothetical protein HDU97_007080 [Phlyctochytrium planicorne]